MSKWRFWLRGSRLLRGGAALTAIGCMAFAAHYTRRGYEECHPPRYRVSAEQVASAKQRLPALQELEVATADGLKLKAWYVAPANGALIVMMPGLGGNRATFLDEAALLARHGYGSLSLEPRAHGDSGGDTATWGYLESDDVIAAVKLMYTQPGVASVGALGHSVGASAVALAAAKDPSIRAVVLYATWPSLREEIAYKSRQQGRIATFFITKGFELSKVDIAAVTPETQLPRVSPRPLLLLSGGLDEDTPPAIMDRVLASCGKPAELWRVPAAGHGGYLQVAPDEYELRVIGFWDRAFRGVKRP